VAELEILLYREGRSTPFSEWLASLKDGRSAGIVRARLNRIRLGTETAGPLATVSRSCVSISVLAIESTSDEMAR
jgi:putative component of toxin-antitoxin plasmid stabilization module